MSSRWGMRPNRPRGEDRWFDPMPPRGLCERVYCAIKARYGYWPADFLAHVERSYRGRIPPRFHAIVARLTLEKPWERCEHGIDLIAEGFCTRCIG